MVSLRVGPSQIARTGEYGEPFTDEVQGGDRAAAAANPVVCQPAVEIPGEGFAGTGAGAG